MGRVPSTWLAGLRRQRLSRAVWEVPRSRMTDSGLPAYIRVNFSSPIMRALYLALGFAVPATAQPSKSPQTVDSASIAIVPRPESLTVGRGRFVINANTVIYTDAASADIARRFAATLLPATGLAIPVR